MKTILFITILSLANVAKAQLDQSHSGSTGTQWTNTHNAEQTFTCGITGNLDTIEVVLKYNYNSVSACSINDSVDIILGIKDFLFNNMMGYSDPIYIRNTGTSYNLAFKFSTPISLVQGRYYSFRVHPVNNSCPNFSSSDLYILTLDPGTYNGGVFQHQIAGLIYGPDEDAIFATYMLNTLPVQLLSFTVNKLYENEVLLKWQTASETNNSHFEIERSENGSSYAKIGNVNGAGNSTIVNSYSFIDNTNSQFEYYYRLKQVDFNGMSHYSKVIKVNTLKSNISSSILVYPNPSKGSFLFEIPNSNKHKVIRISNLFGKTIKEVSTVDDKIEMSIDECKPGIYYINGTSGSDFFNMKVFVE